jgi:hypothetical protein
MPLQILLTTSCLRASYKAAQNVLYLDWQGPLTLSAVQVASAQVAQLVLARRYPRVLICTQQVQTVGCDVATWLAPAIMPGLCLLGTSQVAWVYHDSVDGKALARCFSAPITCKTCLCTDTATAVAWLATQPIEPATTPRPAAEINRLRRVVRVLQWKTLVLLARHPLWLVAECGPETATARATRPLAAGLSAANELVAVR